jgi:hypothetical protein
MTPRNSKSRVDFFAVKRAVSLKAVLRHYQVPGLRRHRDQLQGCCPTQGGNRDDSFRAHLTKNVFQCFARRTRGNVLDFVAVMQKCSIRETALWRRQRLGVIAPLGAPGASLYRAPVDMQNRKLVRQKEASNVPLRFALTRVE